MPVYAQYTTPYARAHTTLHARVRTLTLRTVMALLYWQIRFETTKTQRTRILFITEGLVCRLYEGKRDNNNNNNNNNQADD